MTVMQEVVVLLQLLQLLLLVVLVLLLLLLPLQSKRKRSVFCSKTYVYNLPETWPLHCFELCFDSCLRKLGSAVVVDWVNVFLFPIFCSTGGA